MRPGPGVHSIFIPKDQVVRENREKIGQDVVFPALPALETDGMLAVGTVPSVARTAVPLWVARVVVVEPAARVVVPPWVEEPVARVVVPL